MSKPTVVWKEPEEKEGWLLGEYMGLLEAKDMQEIGINMETQLGQLSVTANSESRGIGGS
jgi:hypothetical protein